ncbi:glycosyltransferase [Chloroflexota bacterium]
MKKILFYATYGGYGHIARNLSINKYLSSSNKIFLVSGMRWDGKLPPNIKYNKLKEIPCSQIINEDGRIIFKRFYSGPQNIEDFRKHLIEYINILKKINPDIVVVDLTSEITIITKLLGYKVISVYETGIRNDLRHLLSYKNCDGILVPYTKGFTDVSYLPKEIQKKMFFSGGFCRFSGYKILPKVNAKKIINESKKLIVVSVGKGDYAEHVIKICVEAIKDVKGVNAIFFSRIKLNKKISNIRFIRVQPAKVYKYLNAADLIICGAGYSTIMENCYFKVPIITIPLKRPYGEQIIKAQNLKKFGAAEVLYEEKISKSLLTKKIKGILNNPKRIKKVVNSHKKVINGNGAKRAAKWISNLIK